MPQVYTITITMTPATVTALSRNGFRLFGFKAVNTAAQGAAPLIWFQTRAFSLTTQLTWMNQYQAYLSASQIVANGAIAVSSAIPINLGQTAVVGEGGHLNAIAQGTPSAIALSSASFEQWTAGIAQPSPDGSPEPTVALPLRGTGTEVITPVDKVLLMLAANALSAGTVIYKAFAPGILVDQTGGPGRRDLHFHDNGVWSWSDGDWATAVEAEADLIPILVRSGS